MDPNMPFSPSPEMGPTPGTQQALLQSMDQKTEQPQTPTEVQAFDALTAAIKAVNNYIKLVGSYDEANAKAARMVLAVLGEMFKTAEFDQQQTQPPMIM